MNFNKNSPIVISRPANPSIINSAVNIFKIPYKFFPGKDRHLIRQKWLNPANSTAGLSGIR
jgi:hypothetical protein